MSENSNSNFVDDNTDSLDDFAAELFGRSEAPKESAPEANGEGEEVEDAQHVETPTSQEEEPDDSVDNPDATEQDADEAKPKKKQTVQERINQLTKEKRESERLAKAADEKYEQLLARLDALDGGKKEPVRQEVKPQDGAPDPDAKNADGTDVYPLGDLDPRYNAALARYEMKQLLEESKAAEAKAAEDAKAQQAQEAKFSEWGTKLEVAIETKYPDMLEKNAELQETFADLAPDYGDFLANTIVDMEYGTDVLYHLASNLDEAEQIVALGPVKAALALGRLEAQFASQNAPEPKLKVTKAPVPPSSLNRGSSVATSVADDTDDLDAFTRKLYKRGA